MITVEDVSKVFSRGEEQVRALDGVSLSVERGEFVAVRGPSGSGKTTLLLTVGGMVRPSAGRVVVDGQDVYALSAPQRAALRAEKIGFVFQMFHLVPYLSVLENVLMPTLAGCRAGRKEAEELLDYLGLSHRLRHRPAELSTGERQRVAIARALLKKPAVILADEPTGNLDPDNSEQVLRYLADFHRGGGTVLLVSHEPIADRYADRVLFLRAGKLVEPNGPAAGAEAQSQPA